MVEEEAEAEEVVLPEEAKPEQRSQNRKDCVRLLVSMFSTMGRRVLPIR